MHRDAHWRPKGPCQRRAGRPDTCWAAGLYVAPSASRFATPMLLHVRQAPPSGVQTHNGLHASLQINETKKKRASLSPTKNLLVHNTARRARPVFPSLTTAFYFSSRWWARQRRVRQWKSSQGRMKIKRRDTKGNAVVKRPAQNWRCRGRRGACNGAQGLELRCTARTLSVCMHWWARSTRQAPQKDGFPIKKTL